MLKTQDLGEFLMMIFQKVKRPQGLLEGEKMSVFTRVFVLLICTCTVGWDGLDRCGGIMSYFVIGTLLGGGRKLAGCQIMFFTGCYRIGLAGFQNCIPRMGMSLVQKEILASGNPVGLIRGTEWDEHTKVSGADSMMDRLDESR